METSFLLLTIFYPNLNAVAMLFSSQRSNLKFGKKQASDKYSVDNKGYQIPKIKYQIFPLQRKHNVKYQKLNIKYFRCIENTIKEYQI